MYTRALPLCPVDGCPQPHAPEVWDALNQPATLLFPVTARPQPGKPLRWPPSRPSTRRWTLDVTERSRTVDKLLRDHLETHDVLDFVKTIQRLQQDIGQYESGIRPHTHRDNRLDRSVEAAVEQLGPERLGSIRW